MVEGSMAMTAQGCCLGNIKLGKYEKEEKKF